MTINAVSIIPDVTLKIRAMIASGVADPISTTRDENSKFVMTSKPKRPVEYPMIRVETSINNAKKAGIKSNMMTFNLTSEINVYAKSTKQLDKLAGSAMNYFRTQQHTIDGTIDNGLYDFMILNGFPMPTDIVEGNKNSKESRNKFVFEINYNYIAV